jgi:2-iminobutanoate/2-iminopropanoate deaminase
MNRRKFIRQTGATALGAAAVAQTTSTEGKAQTTKPRPKTRSLKRKVQTDQAPRPVGPYSQAIVAGNTIYVAGQVPADPKTREAVTGPFEDQAVRVFENIKAILEAAGASMDNVVRVNVYLADLGDFRKMNEIYQRYFKEDFPARTTVGAQLLATYKIEVDCIAVK